MKKLILIPFIFLFLLGCTNDKETVSNEGNNANSNSELSEQVNDLKDEVEKLKGELNDSLKMITSLQGKIDQHTGDIENVQFLADSARQHAENNYHWAKRELSLINVMVENLPNVSYKSGKISDVVKDSSGTYLMIDYVVINMEERNIENPKVQFEKVKVSDDLKIYLLPDAIYKVATLEELIQSLEEPNGKESIYQLYFVNDELVFIQGFRFW
jgi:predicted RNase H-like nuclease (RuvC/YqgF family)